MENQTYMLSRGYFENAEQFFDSLHDYLRDYLYIIYLEDEYFDKGIKLLLMDTTKGD